MSNIPQLCAVAPLLGYASFTDIATRTISDRVSVAVLTIGIIGRLSLGGVEVATSLAVAFAIFAVLLIPFSRAMLGGGDVKLIAALAAGFAPLQSLAFLQTTALAGGVLGLSYLAARSFTPTVALQPHAGLLHRVAAVEMRRIGRHAPLPYGVAIAVGALVTVLEP